MNISDDLLINNNLLKGVFWLILMCISGVAIVPTYSKKFINLINKNDIIKHIVILWSIYFLTDFTNNKYENPLVTFKQTILIWIGYLVISKQPLYFNVFNFLIITCIYVINKYNDYLISQTDEDTDKIKRLTEISNILVILLVVSSVMGLVSFYKYEKNYKQSKFENAKFVFGSKI